MKFAILLLALISQCRSAPAPQPVPKAAPAPVAKPDPGVFISTNPAVYTSPIVSYSHYYKSPVYQALTPLVYDLGYASAYSYNSYPYYVPVHIL